MTIDRKWIMKPETLEHFEFNKLLGDASQKYEEVFEDRRKLRLVVIAFGRQLSRSGRPGHALNTFEFTKTLSDHECVAIREYEKFLSEGGVA